MGTTFGIEKRMTIWNSNCQKSVLALSVIVCETATAFGTVKRNKTWNSKLDGNVEKHWNIILDDNWMAIETVLEQ